MINLDPSLLDQDKTRKKKRMHLLRLCAIPISVIMIVSLFFLSSWFYNLIYFVSYSNKNFPIAEGITETRFLMNVLEPYIANYNQGVAELRMGEFKKAETSFQKSIENNPPESKICKVYENYSLSIEKQADAKRSGGNYGEAIELYYFAEAVLYSNGCAGSNGTDGASYNADAARDRITNSRNDAVNEMNRSYDENDTSLDEAREKQLTDDDLDESESDNIAPNTTQGLQYTHKGNADYHCNYKSGAKCW
ncbi:MAG: hypothetical protein K6F57_03580 [Candidatus Saccharibacteria bacterium]|nr:hypothetical protein [Candidatus Saccharibacteria bacterium]